MSDQEKKEQEIMNQEISQDEMDTIAGGWCKQCSDTVEGGEPPCFLGSYGSNCDAGTALKNGRSLYRPDGSVNCAATVEDGSHCGSNDACYEDETVYLGMKDCIKAWK
jgi:hypothetical protein